MENEFTGDSFKALLVGAIDNQKISVNVKTNFSPEFAVYKTGQGSGETGALSGLIKAGVIVRDENGKQIAKYGDYPETNYIMVVGLVSIIALSAFIIVRGVIK